MRLLADQSFPASIEQNRSLELEIVRWNAERVADVDLLREGSSLGATGVLVLGVQALLSETFRSMSAELGMYVGATLEDNPFIASRIIGNLLPILRREAKPRALHVLFAREVRTWDEFTRTRARARS